MRKLRVGCKQVLDFMKKEGWYDAYKKETIKYMKAIDDPDNPLDIRMKRHLLRCLFCFNGTEAIVDNLFWATTSDGYDFWDGKNNVLKEHFLHIPLRYKTVMSR